MKYALALLICFCLVDKVNAAAKPRRRKLPASIRCQTGLAPQVLRGMIDDFPFQKAKRIHGDPTNSLAWLSERMGAAGVKELDEALEKFTYERSLKNPETWLSWKQFTAGKSLERLTEDLEGKYIATAATIKTFDGQITRTALGIVSAYDPNRAEPLMITELDDDREIPLNPKKDAIYIRIEK